MPTGFHGRMDVQITAFTASDAPWLIARHGAIYAEDEGFDDSFPVLVAEIVAQFLAAPDPSRQAGWIARAADLRLGSIFCVGEDAATPEIAKLRLFLIEKSARGTGLAQALLDTCLGFARSAGYRHMRLWTHESHRAAGRLYARNGFVLTQSHPVRSFGVDLVNQIWERAL